MNTQVTKYTTTRFNFEQQTPSIVTDAKRRARAAQQLRLAARLLELRAVTPVARTHDALSPADAPRFRLRVVAAKDEWEQSTSSTRSRAYYRGQLLEAAFQRKKGHRTYYTFKGKASAVKEAARLTLAPYTWAGPNPYSPRTDEEEDLEGGRLWMVVSHCSSVE